MLKDRVQVYWTSRVENKMRFEFLRFLCNEGHRNLVTPILTPLHVRGEIFSPDLYSSSTIATDLPCYLVEGIVCLLLCWSSLARSIDNQDENPCPGHL